MQDVGSMETIFVDRHTDFFLALQSLTETSVPNTRSLITMNQIRRIIAVPSPDFKQASLLYDELNAQPPSVFKSRKTVKPKSFVSTTEPIFPRLESVILASGLRSGNNDGPQDKDHSRDVSLHLRPRHAVPHGLQIQLAQLANDNKATYYQYKSRDHSEDAEPAWPQVSWAKSTDYFIYHLEPDCEHVAQSVANSWSPGDFWVCNGGSEVTARFISQRIRDVGSAYDGGNLSAEVYWPDPVDLAEEDKTAWLATQQARLNGIIDAMGGTSLAMQTGKSKVRMMFMSQAKFFNPLAELESARVQTNHLHAVFYRARTSGLIPALCERSHIAADLATYCHKSSP